MSVHEPVSNVADGSSPRIDIQTENSKDVEFQKYTTDLKYIGVNFFETLCGWRPVTEKKTASVITGDKEYTEAHYQISQRARFINEEGAYTLAKYIDGLISHVRQTGDEDRHVIYTQWRGASNQIRFMLIEAYHLDGNPFEMKRKHLGYIYGKCLSYYGISYKAEGGFLIKEMMRTIMAVFNQNLKGSDVSQEQRKGILDRLLPDSRNR